MIRFVGGAMICTVSSYFGFYMADRLKKRRNFLREMVDSLSFIGREMEFGRYELHRIFANLCDTATLFGFFKICNDKIEDWGIKKSWEHAVCEISCDACLKNEDKAALMTLSGELGMTDINGQRKAIERTVSALAECEKKADEEYIRLSKAYRGCGVLLGVFFLILSI